MNEWLQMKLEPVAAGKMKLKKDRLQSNPVVTLATTLTENVWVFDPKKYSKWLKMTRVLAWIQRFVSNCKLSGNHRELGELRVDEITEAEIKIIKTMQHYESAEEYKCLTLSGKVLPLNPRIDENDLIRPGGRLENADDLSFDIKDPIILPRGICVTKLIVNYYHEKDHHVASQNQTLAKISQRFWILRGKEEVRECENNCYSCKRRKAKIAKQIMAPFPALRLKKPLRAFSKVSVDYGGPFITIQGRGRKIAERYLCLFTFSLSRAVQLEMVYSLDTGSFLNAFYRMTSCRGLPQEVMSDNGTNFVGANTELKEFISKLDKSKIEKSAANNGIKCQFKPPLGPHVHGVHETMIRAAKRAIYCILSKADITDEELSTEFTGAENLINPRPLTYQTADIKDDIPLTPNHFLCGLAGGEFAPDSVDTQCYNLTKRWRRVQEW